MYAVGFQFDLYKHTTGIKPVLQDYSWWIALVSKIASQVDKFEIRCWSDETEAIVTGQQFGEQLENIETTELVFQGQISEAFLGHIYVDGFDENGGLKWFTINLYQGEELLFHSGHYGTEPFVFVKTKEKAQQLEGWSKQYPIISRVDILRHSLQIRH
ncbi:MAG: hypothetical protein PHS04_06955 [Tissierellia bacterium]|nr:hypothetical protein [Tissierellia bacterium]